MTDRPTDMRGAREVTLSILNLTFSAGDSEGDLDFS